MSIAMHEWPRRHRITVEHFYRMAEAGGQQLPLRLSDDSELLPDWVVDLRANQVHTFRSPLDAKYAETATIELGRLSLAALAGVEIDLAPLRP